MKMKTVGLILLIISAASKLAFAQQAPMYTQYMFNTLVINPAYTGSQESMSLTCLARRQWVGLEGVPATETFSIHTPIKNRRVALGLLLIHDKIGITNQSDVKATYAYRIPLWKGKLSLGLQGG